MAASPTAPDRRRGCTGLMRVPAYPETVRRLEAIVVTGAASRPMRKRVRPRLDTEAMWSIRARSVLGDSRSASTTISCLSCATASRWWAARKHGDELFPDALRYTFCPGPREFDHALRFVRANFRGAFCFKMKAALILLATLAAATPAAAQQAATAMPAQSLRIEATFDFSINGEMVTGTSHARTASAWQGSFSAKDMLPPDASGVMRLINKPGESFVVRAQRDDETWEFDCQTTPLSGGSLQMDVRVKHNDGFVAENRQTLADGETKSVEIGGPDAGEVTKDRLSLIYTLLRIDAAALPADHNGAFKQASINVGAQTADKSAASPSKPSEIASYRRMRPPHYPPSALRAGVQGKVMVNVAVGADGAPVWAEVFGIEPASAVELGGAAVAAALQWRYNPAMRDGKAIAESLFVSVDFFLKPDKGEKLTEPDPVRPLPVTYRKLTTPVYPATAMANHASATVFVRAEIAADGSLGVARVEQALPDSAADFGEAALQAVKQWRFSPEVVDGVARAAAVRIPLEFRADANTAPAPLAGSPPLEPIHTTLQTIVVAAP
ncbi:MAG: TonB family protein [Proteobacteria bacterium]|nr:TonB family protein [Pseudomonadota bacterium]